MGKPKKTRPPKDLGAAGRALWSAIQAGYGINDPGGMVLLMTAARCADLEANAMETAHADGLVGVDRYGQRRPHPLLSVARDARSQKLQALRQLNLDVEPLHERPGR